jgi:hypothetical protein
MALLHASTCFGVAFTDRIAETGRPALLAKDLPEGIAALVNDSHRTTGWNDFFSSWCNDVNYYAFAVKSTDEINMLLEKLAAVKCDVKEVRLSYHKEPRGLGWTTQLPEGNNAAVLFSIGNQSEVDRWFARTPNPFGQIKFKACPVAVPPTLTLFVQNEVVDLDKLKIPAGVTVIAAYVPSHFYRWNTIEDESRPQRQKPKLDEASLAASDRIDAFIKQIENAKQR